MESKWWLLRFFSHQPLGSQDEYIAPMPYSRYRCYIILYWGLFCSQRLYGTLHICMTTIAFEVSKVKCMILMAGAPFRPGAKVERKNNPCHGRKSPRRIVLRSRSKYLDRLLRCFCTWVSPPDSNFRLAFCATNSEQ